MKIILFHLFLLLMYPGKRALFIFYNQQGEALKREQLAELEKDRAGIRERDIIIHTVPANAAIAEIKKYRINDSDTFIIILIGKDGGEKLRSDTVLSTAKLFSTIDAMPMRKEEMRDN